MELADLADDLAGRAGVLADWTDGASLRGTKGVTGTRCVLDRACSAWYCSVSRQGVGVGVGWRASNARNREAIVPSLTSGLQGSQWSRSIQGTEASILVLDGVRVRLLSRRDFPCFQHFLLPLISNGTPARSILGSRLMRLAWRSTGPCYARTVVLSRDSSAAP